MAFSRKLLLVLIALALLVYVVHAQNAESVCDNTRNQSPVDISRNNVVPVQGRKLLEPNYPSTSVILSNKGVDELKLAFPDNYGGSLTINGITYKLVDFHLHIPSEHTVEGDRYAMEGHAVHITSAGDIAVVGIFYKVSRSEHNSFIRQFEHELRRLGSNGELTVRSLDPSKLEVENKEFYRYDGSLTTPPFCSGVLWNVLKEEQLVSTQQFQLITTALNATNARPVQDLGERIILYYKQDGLIMAE